MPEETSLERKINHGNKIIKLRNEQVYEKMFNNSKPYMEKNHKSINKLKNEQDKKKIGSTTNFMKGRTSIKNLITNIRVFSCSILCTNSTSSSFVNSNFALYAFALQDKSPGTSNPWIAKLIFVDKNELVKMVNL
jgi:hypothetical protein